MTLGNLGMLYARQGNEEKAAETYEEAIAIFQELGERGNEKAVARQLGKLKIKKGRFLDALGDYEEELGKEDAPSGPQKLARQLFRMLGRLTGGGQIQEEDGDDEGEVIDA
jgi:tetratricopeptide (TPR) repeat protein